MKRFLLLLAFSSCLLCNKAEAGSNDWYYGRNALGATWVITPAGNGPGVEFERSFINTNKFTFLIGASYHPSKVEVGHRTNSPYFLLERVSKQPAYLYLLRPGVRWYVGGRDARFRYAVGFNLWLGTGTGQGTDFYETGQLFKGYPDEVNKVEPRTMLGFVFSHSLHFQATPNLRFSLEGGIGEGKDTRKGFRRSDRVLNMSYFRNLSLMVSYRW